MGIKARRPFWIAFIFASLIYFFLPGYVRWEKAREELAYYKNENRRLREDNLKMRKEIWALKNDPLYIEETSRKDLGYARDGEVIYEIERE